MRPGTNNLIRALFTVVAAMVVLWVVQVMSSAWIRARGDQQLAKDNFSAAERLFKLAGRIDSQNWQAKWGLGLVYYHFRYDELDPIRKHEWALKELAAYEDAYRTNTKQPDVVYGAGRVELFLRNRDKGLEDLRTAAYHQRFNDFYWRKLGIELRKAGLYEEALRAFEYAQKLDRSNKTVSRNIQWIRQHRKIDR